MRSHLSAIGGAAKLGFFVTSLTVASLGARLATADVGPGSSASAEIRSLASRMAGGETTRSPLAETRLRDLVTAQRLSLFGRFDPAGKPIAAISLVHGYEGPAPLFHLPDLKPQSAEAINAAVPFDDAPNPAARPFVLSGSAEDKARALTCMTQAVYYEAGFEPEAGEAAVAQVVLNRMRHPIFPHSVCGVVFQGAELKTGCQFSFTCDGSLDRTPQPAAWDRAKRIAQQALSGHVEKAVGGATHYHTRFVSPWWRPTVSKVAEVGAHIFYRWSGALGLPAAFTSHYAGVEQVRAAPIDLALATPLPEAERQKRAMAELALAVARTPRERLLALSAQGSLGAGFDASKLATTAPGVKPSEDATSKPDGE